MGKDSGKQKTIRTKIKNHESRQLEVRLMDDVRRIQKEQLDDDFGIGDVSPLFAEILAESFPNKFKLPSLDKYNGKTDPHSHLANFHITMLLDNINDIVLCRMFPSTLIELAQKWYQHLIVNSIYDFKELVYAFKQ